MSKILPASLSGIVTRYKGNGRKFGYPTANFHTTTELDDGVYFGFANMGEFNHHAALIFIGTPTTVGDTERRVEAWLPDIPDKDYYGEDLQLEVAAFHRDNQHFGSIEELLEVMKSDEATARQWFAAQS
jgi:riboflavin kinase/FMN adenylyltransferase